MARQQSGLPRRQSGWRWAAIAGLSVVTFLGLLVATLIGVANAFGPGPFPEQYPYSHYLVASALWGMTVVPGGILLALRHRRWRSEALLPVLLGADLALLLAILWPVEALLLAVGLALRARRARQRVGAIAVGALLLVAGGWWGLDAYARQHVRDPGPVVAGQLTGTWHEAGGPGALELRADGNFTLRHATPGLDPSLPTGTATDEAGTWMMQDGDVPSVLLTPARGRPAELSDLFAFDVQLIGPAQVLCLQTDPDEGRCPSGLHR
ncbi:hypothetical protein [Kitasatospora viridis]|uniref:hypothetical protein n=1 Tax=Kitasatospora viridis TaxID=281105 RepID=UPI0011A5E097|nr:hypothetical protein [Kitasatospora viridis]